MLIGFVPLESETLLLYVSINTDVTGCDLLALRFPYENIIIKTRFLYYWRVSRVDISIAQFLRVFGFNLKKHTIFRNV